MRPGMLVRLSAHAARGGGGARAGRRSSHSSRDFREGSTLFGVNFCRRFVILKKLKLNTLWAPPPKFGSIFHVQSALDAIFADAESIFFLFASERGVNQGSEASKTLFPESDLVPNESQSAPPRNGVSDFAALPLLSPRWIFLHFCAFLLGSSPPSVVSRDAASVPASVSRGPYSGGPRRAMEGAHDLLNDFQGEAKLNGMVRPLP